MLNQLKILKGLFCLCLWAFMTQLFAAPDPWQLNMFRGVTPLSRDMYNLHMIGMLICTIIGILVFGVMIYSLIHHRKSKGHKPATFHDNLRFEIIWTIIPFIILVGLAVPATKILMRLDDTDNAYLTIKVVGYQWKWQYNYLDQGISYFSSLSTPYDQLQNKAPKNEHYLLEVDNPVVVPIHKKIRFLVTSNDVVHSWWVPELGIKRDAIPGFMHEAWARIDKPGFYRGQCAELCGLYHGFMPIVVQAVSEEDFAVWVAKQKDKLSQDKPASRTMTRDELMTLGKEKYDMICAACHQVDGRGIPPLYPALKGSSIAVGHPQSRHINLILKGVPGSAMQSYADQLSDEEIASITTYERNAWKNDTAELIQPAEVAAERIKNKKIPKRVNKAQAGGF